jgi:hypothetical protein
VSTITKTTITHGITLGTSGKYASPLTIASDGAVEASSGDAIYGNIAPATIANHGTIAATGTSGFGIDLKLGGRVSNTGLVQGYTGVYITGAYGTVTNSGTIAGTGASGDGVYLGQGGSVANNAGLIEGSGGVYINAAAGTVTNSGTIIGTSGSGVNLLGGGRIVNHGAIQSPNTAYTVVVVGGGYLTNSQGGYIGSGGVFFGGGTGTIVNHGQIVDTNGLGVDLDAGGSVGNTGLIEGSSIGIGIYGAAGTITNSGTISGGGGTAISFGGTGSNLLVLENGYKLVGGVYGNASATNTVKLAGSAGAAVSVDFNTLGFTNFQYVLFGTGGNDTLKVSNTSGTLVSNTSGTVVTIRGFVTNTDTIDLTAIGTNGRITNNDTINHLLTITGSLGAVTLQLDASDSTSLTTAADGAGGTDVTVAHVHPLTGTDRIYTAATQAGGAAAAATGTSFDIPGATIISVSGGDQTLTADTSPEIFDFSSLSVGNDTIVGFDPTQDTIRLSSSLAGSFAAVQSDTSSTVGGTVITLDPTRSITLSSINPADLTPTNFRFA